MGAHVAGLVGAGALAKLGRPGRFRRTLHDYRLLPEAAVAPAGRAVPVVEIALAGMLLLLPFAAMPRLGAAAMLLSFAMAMAVNLLRGRAHIDCGCGSREQPIGWLLVARNVALAAGVAAAPVVAVPPLLAAQALAAGLLVALLAAAFPALKGIAA